MTSDEIARLAEVMGWRASVIEAGIWADYIYTDESGEGHLTKIGAFDVLVHFKFEIFYDEEDLDWVVGDTGNDADPIRAIEQAAVERLGD